MSRGAAADLLTGAGLAALAGALHASALGFWFSYDDFWHFHYLLTHGPLELCCGPGFWRQLAGKGMFTPLLFLSLGADLASFGLGARPFYAHQLAAFALSTAALYGVLRLWLGRGAAAAGAALFVVGVPTASLVALLMTRHYIEAILLALLSVACFVRAARTGRRGWAVASAAFYLAAALAKEVAVPLPVILALLPVANARARLRLSIAHWVALSAYFVLRVALLGRLFGAYGWAVGPGDLPRLVLSLPGKIAAEFLGGRGVAGWALFGALAVGTGLAALAGRRAALLLAVALLCALLPVLPVSTEMEPRYAVPAWIAITVAFAAGCERLRHVRAGSRSLRAPALALAALACLSALLVFLELRQETVNRMRRIGAEGRAFLALGPGDVLRHPLGHAASFPELRWLKEDHLGRARGSGWFYDDLFLCLRGAEIRRLWEYDATRQQVVEVTPRLAALRADHCGAIRRRMPLAADFWHTGTALHWELGPYRRGGYTFVLGDGIQTLAVPRRGGFYLGAQTVALKLRYDSPSGWVTYSPELTMDFARARRHRFARAAARN